MIARTRRIHGGFADEMLYAAIEQFQSRRASPACC